jgi:hypothetical protein
MRFGGRRHRRALLAAGLAVAGILGLAQGASGEGRYFAVQCYPGVGSQDHSSAEYAGASRYKHDPACSDQGLGVYSPRRLARGQRGEWTISAPKGTRFSELSLQSRQRAPKGWRSDVDLIDIDGRAVALPGLGADGSWKGGRMSGSFRAVTSELACIGRSGKQGRDSRRRRCSRTRHPYVYLRNLKFTVADFAPPHLSVTGGTLPGVGVKAGVKTLEISASDQGGGLSRTFLRVNGVATAIHTYRCDLAKLGGRAVGDTLRPCPQSRTETLMANTSAAPFKPGPNQVQACAIDYADSTDPLFAANSSCSPAQTVIANGGCDRVAAISGRDADAGSASAPFRSAQRLVDSLGFGERGCLRTGTYDQNNTIEVRRPGVTLTSFPGERATLKGELKLEKGADRVTVSYLNLDGRSSYNLGPMVFSSDTLFSNLDVTNYDTGICFILGAADPAYGRAVRTVIENSRIHNCGHLPAQNGDHGLYVEHSDGAIIRNNWIYDNADRGIQLYPDSQGTQVYGNVIDGNGEGIIISSDGSSPPSSNNLIRNNVISNSKLRWNVEHSWPGGRVGTGNVVRNNCLWATNSDPYYRSNGGIQGGGFTATANVVADPRFVSRFWKDFHLQPGSPCTPILG